MSRKRRRKRRGCRRWRRKRGGAFKLTTFNPVVLGHEFCAEIIDFGRNL